MVTKNHEPGLKECDAFRFKNGHNNGAVGNIKSGSVDPKSFHTK
jgi:hypothetical protein